MPSLKRRLPWLIAGTLAAGCLSVYLIGCNIGSPSEMPDAYWPLDADPQFVDLEGDPDEDLIEGLARLGVIPLASGVFRPEKVIERGDYVMWLVRAHDIFWRDEDDARIWLAPELRDKVTPSFTDVQPNVGHFPYIQGMVESGHIVGFEQGSYEYARTITREHVVLLRAGITLGTANVVAPAEEIENLRILLENHIEDADKVTDEYVAAVLADLSEGDTIELAFGEITELRPKQLVTRREAARSLRLILGRTWEMAEKIQPLMRPLPSAVTDRLQKEAEAEAAKSGGDGHNH